MAKWDHDDLRDKSSEYVQGGGFIFKGEEEKKRGNTIEVCPPGYQRDANGNCVSMTTSNNISKGAPNPKDLMGAKKVNLSLIPSVSNLHLAMAMMDGARKYGPYNWRDYPVELMTYISAAKRHLDAFMERQEVASDSGVHHLGHAMACCAIILDAMNEDSFIDNRPKSSGSYHKVVEELNTQCKEKSEKGVK